MSWLRRWDEQQQRVHERRREPDLLEAPEPVSGWRRYLLAALTVASVALAFVYRWFLHSEVEVPPWTIAAAGLLAVVIVVLGVKWDPKVGVRKPAQSGERRDDSTGT